MMKNKLIQTFGLVTLSIVIGSMQVQINTRFDGWNGTVSFLKSEKGPFITISEWRIEGIFKNGTGPILHNSNYKSKWNQDEIVSKCVGEGDGRVEISIDEITKTYCIYVSGVPACTGLHLEKGVTSNFAIPGGDTVILIDRQPLGTNPALLSGTVTLKEGPYDNGKTQTLTYKWNLVKTP